MLYTGPVVTVYDSEPPGGNVPVVFAFDPPVALPSKGWYAFWVQADRCSQQDYYLLEYQNHGDDPYPLGNESFTIRSVNDCIHVPPVAANEYDVDLCFSIVFCHDAITVVRRTSWGSLKMLYR